MALTLVSPPEYKIDVCDFDDRIFTASSTAYLSLPDAVQFARERNSVLQSAAEAVAFRIAANGTDNANNYQVTRTAALYARNGDQCIVAFDDDSEENILLAQPMEGFDAHKSTGKWLVPTTHPLITAALDRARRTNRILPLPRKNEIRLTTAARNGTSAYAANTFVKAILGNLAEPYANFLKNSNYKNGHVWSLTTDNLQHLGVDHNTVEVRRVGVGGVGIDYLGASDRCVDYGRACGVRNISTGNQGS
jgi:hypothetical protein